MTAENDQLHRKALEVSRGLRTYRIITSDSVLVEFLSAFSDKGEVWRRTAVKRIDMIMSNPNIEVEPQTRTLFKEGLELYKDRLDKEYSLTDCISMRLMKRRGITETLTEDHHFEQEGFIKLL